MKTLMNYSAIIITMIAFLGASTINAQEWTKDQKEVWQVIDNSWANIQIGEYEAYFESIHDKYLGWNNEDPLPINKEKWMKSMNMGKEFAKVTYYDLDPARILVYDKIAVVHYYLNWTITFTKDEESVDKNFNGKNAEFLIKEDGKWLLIGDMTYLKSNE